jgi:hypothetical protein
MDGADAFAEALQALLFGKNAPGTRTKALQHVLWLGGVQQNDALDLRSERAHLA